MQGIKSIGMFFIVGGAFLLGIRKCYEIYMYKKQLGDIIFMLEKIKAHISYENFDLNDIFCKLKDASRKDVTIFADRATECLKANEYREKMPEILKETFVYVNDNEKETLLEYFSSGYRSDRNSEVAKTENVLKYYRAGYEILCHEYKNKIKVNMSLAVFAGMIMAIIIV